MGCNCGKNRSSVTKSKALSDHFNKKINERTDVKPESVPQVQTNEFRGDNSPPKKVIKIKQPSLGEKVKNFAKAMGSRVTQGRASDDIVNLRTISCHGNEDIPPCPYRGDSSVREGYHYCTACGCGDRPQTWLNNPDDPEAYTKLHYPWVSCPVRNPGFGDYKPFDLEDQEQKQVKKDGMDRKRVIEAYLNASGIPIPDHPAPQPKNGE